MAYTDELEPLLALAQELRRTIALRIAEEAGRPLRETPSEDDLTDADQAIEDWRLEGEEEADSRAFRPIGPLQKLLSDYQDICERIADIRDRRLS